ncbi:MAG: Two-component transcriptional response regulator, LuxR family [uncultured Corynebacteriales bacterium]|uniref:Two-component transcriptional response regulator, LuxR family n=1 Tax=uncultured Mycobacteriales bacterium TaxID=581187 RepID=A0A6J4JB61_9ACTN|nr:MAG: Two-component transcriptional response regulator, LuxR family [uncultured Corynebacteriales bacterium]
MLRVLVCDDEPLVRAGLAVTLAAQPGIEVVGEAADGTQAVDRARQLVPDVVVMDIRMPGLDGIAATRRLVRDFPVDGPRILILTMFHSDDYVARALVAGASGFVLKDAVPAELATAVRVVGTGEAVLSPAVTRRLIDRLARQAPAAREPAELRLVTGREREVLLQLGLGRSNPEIAAVLGISRETVKTHVSRILMKLGLRDRVHAVVFAHRHGLVAGPDGDPAARPGPPS